MSVTLAPYNWAVTLLGGGDHGRRRFMSLVNLAAQAVAVTLSLPLVLSLTGGRWGTNNDWLTYFLLGPLFFFPLLVVLQALVVVLSGSLNYALNHQHEEERRRTYLILSWIAAFVFAVLLSVLLCLFSY